MLTVEISIGPLNTELSLINEQTAGEKCRCVSIDALQFWVIRMRTNTNQHKVDFGVEGSQTRQNGTSATEVTMLTGAVGV